MTLLDRARSLLKRRPASTEGHTETARETGVALGLMAQAADAAEPTPEQQIFLSQAEHGMRERLSMLLGIPHRSLAQEREKLAIEQWLARGSPQEPVQAPRRIKALLSPSGLATSLASMAPLLPWIIGGTLLFTVTGWGTSIWNGWRVGNLERRVEILTDERDAPCTATEVAGHTTRAACRSLAHANDALAQAGDLTRQVAADLTAERTRNAAAAARERRRNREIANVLTHSPDPPSWSLRDDGLAGETPTSPSP